MRARVSIITSLMVGLVSGTAACGEGLFRTCDDIQEEARALVQGRQTCSAGDGCVIVQMSDMAANGSCLGAFQCAVAVRADVDLNVFSAQATALNDDYDGCPMCVMAGCMNTQDLDACCDTDAGRCVVDVGGSVCDPPEARP